MTPESVCGFEWDGESDFATWMGRPLPFPHVPRWTFNKRKRELVASGAEEDPDGDALVFELWVPCGENGAYLYVGMWHDRQRLSPADRVGADLYVGQEWRQAITDKGHGEVIIEEDPPAIFDPLTNRVCVLPDPPPAGWFISRYLGAWGFGDLDDPVGRMGQLIHWLGAAKLVEIDRAEMLRLEGLWRHGRYNGTPCGAPGLEGDFIAPAEGG